MTMTLIVGLGGFGQAVLRELHELGHEVAVLDQDKSKVESVRDRCAMSAVVNAENLEALEKLVPEGLQSVVIDCGGKENPFLNVQLAKFYHDKMIPRIVALAYSTRHAEILRMIGATEAVVPELESASRLARSLARPGFSSFLPVSEDFAVAEIPLPPQFVGKKLGELELRKRFGVMAVAVKRVYQGKESYRLPDAGDELDPECFLVLVGPEKALAKLG